MYKKIIDDWQVKADELISDIAIDYYTLMESVRKGYDTIELWRGVIDKNITDDYRWESYMTTEIKKKLVFVLPIEYTRKYSCWTNNYDLKNDYYRILWWMSGSRTVTILP